MLAGLIALREVVLVDYGPCINIMLTALHHAPRLERVELQLTQDATTVGNLRADLPDASILKRLPKRVRVFVLLTSATQKFTPMFSRELPDAHIQNISRLL